jgi:cell shape-determining protein MreC
MIQERPLAQTPVPWLMFGLGVVVIAILEQVHVISPLRQVISESLAPLLRFEAQVVSELSWPARVWQQKMSNYQMLVQLEKQYAQAAAEATQAAALKQENEELRKLLGEKDRPAQTVQIVAPVISYGRPTVIFEKGVPVKEGTVVLYGKTLLGRVGVVSSNQATVELLTAPVLQPLLVKTESGVTGLVNGNGKQVLLSEIPANAELKVGEKIETAGQVDVPAHLFIGTIQSVERLPDLPIQRAVLSQPVDFYQTHLVELLL